MSKEEVKNNKIHTFERHTYYMGTTLDKDDDTLVFDIILIGHNSEKAKKYQATYNPLIKHSILLASNQAEYFKDDALLTEGLSLDPNKVSLVGVSFCIPMYDQACQVYNYYGGCDACVDLTKRSEPGKENQVILGKEWFDSLKNLFLKIDAKMVSFKEDWNCLQIVDTYKHPEWRIETTLLCKQRFNKYYKYKSCL